MRYRLRTLMMVLTFAPPVLAGCWLIGRELAPHREPLEWFYILGIAGFIVAAATFIVVVFANIWSQPPVDD